MIDATRSGHVVGEPADDLAASLQCARCGTSAPETEWTWRVEGTDEIISRTRVATTDPEC